MVNTHALKKQLIETIEKFEDDKKKVKTGEKSISDLYVSLGRASLADKILQEYFEGYEGYSF